MAIRFDAGTDLLLGGGWSGTSHTILTWHRLQVDRNTDSGIWFVYPLASAGGAVRAIMETDATGTAMFLFDSAFTTQTGPASTVGTWYVTAAVMDGVNWTLYHGTTPSSLTTVGPSTRVAYTSPGSFTIGNGTEWINGDVANFKIFNAALTSGQVATELANYNVASAVSSSLIRRHSFKTTSLTPEEGTAGTALTAGTTAVALASDPPINDALFPTGIASSEAFGTAAVSQQVGPNGIGTTEAFGSHVVSQNIVGTGIASAQAIGSHTVALGGYTLFPSSIAGAEAFGTAELSTGVHKLQLGSVEVDAVKLGSTNVSLYYGSALVFS